MGKIFPASLQVTAQQSQLGGTPGNPPADEAAKEPEVRSGPSAVDQSPAASNSVGGANGVAPHPEGIAAQQNRHAAAVLPEQVTSRSDCFQTWLALLGRSCPYWKGIGELARA